VSNWIKVDVNTPYKDGIESIMEACRISRGEAFLAWFKLYTFLDGLTATGVVNMTRDEIDGVSGHPGVADALEYAGWLTFNGRRCAIKDWLERNGQSARARSDQMARISNARWHPQPPMRHA